MAATATVTRPDNRLAAISWCDHPKGHVQTVRTISVIFPAFNEEDNIRCTVETMIRVLAEVAIQWEINTEILAQATQFGMRINRVKVNHFPRRYRKRSGSNVHVVVKAFRGLCRLWRKLRHVAPDQAGLYSATEEPSTAVHISSPLQK